MRKMKRFIWFILVPLLLITVSAGFMALMNVEPAGAQCGTSASSCKTCHEVQAKAPVNTDGTRWHQSHAFGDFCVFCHAGNQQATVKDDAHVGMVPPLSDVKSACQSCHSTDLNARAQVYAVLLKVTPGSGGSAANPVAQTTATVQSAGAATEQPTVIAPVANVPAVTTPVAGIPNNSENKQIVVDDPNTVDYVQRYNEIVLGQRPVNWGNITLVALIGLVLIGGGAFVIFNEMKTRMAFSATQRVEGEYPVEVVDMLPALASLRPQSRQSLRNILAHPRKTDRVLGVIDTLVSEDKTEEQTQWHGL